MPISYARCNSFMSGATSAVGVNCKFMAQAESEAQVLEQVYEHLSSVHKIDGHEMVNTITRCIFTKGTKNFHNRGPEEDKPWTRHDPTAH